MTLSYPALVYAIPYAGFLFCGYVIGMNLMSGTAYFQFSPMVLRVSQRDGIMIALAPLNFPEIPSSRIDCTIEHMNAGKYSFALLSSMSAPQVPIGTNPIECTISSGV